MSLFPNSVKHLFLFNLLIFPTLIYSQHIPFISGKVHDKNNHPLAGANVQLLKADSSLIANAFTDKTGFYKLSNNDTAIAFIKAALIGFNSEVKLHTKIATINFVLFEAKNKTMKEVNIMAKKSLVEFKADRTIFNVENSIAAAGGDAMDAIKRAPGVSIIHNEISIAGKNSVSVMINGRLQQLSGDDLNQLLHSIPADNISKIEVITSPSSKYDAEGNAGIINIVLKKNKQKGFRGNITTTYEFNNPLSFPTASTSLFYKKNNLNLFCNANGGAQGWNYAAYTDTYYPDQFWHQDVKYPYINSYARFQLGGDYTLSKRSTLGFMMNEGYSWLNNDESIIASSYDLNHHLDSTVTTNGKTTDKYLGKLTSNLNYEYRFDTTGKKMNVDIDYYRQKGNKHRDFTVENRIPLNSSVNQTTSRMTGSPLTEIMSAKVDFEMPLKKINFSFGMKASYSQNDLNNLYETKNNSDYVKDTSKSNHFIYHEEIEAAYINATKSLRKFELSAGLRVEHTRGHGNSVTTSQGNIVDYTKLFPSGVVQYSLTKNQIVSLSFARRISRPGYNFLNPFRFYYSPNTFVQGNPELQPSFNYLTKLGYAYKSNMNATLLYNYITNYFDRVYTVDTIHQTNMVSRKNLGRKQVVALEIDGSLQPTKWWELSGNINGGFMKFEASEVVEKAAYSGFNWWIEATNIFYINKKKTLAAELGGYYYSPRQRDYVYWSAMSAVNAGFRYSMLNKNLVVSFYGEDLFAKSYWLQTNKLNNTVEYSFDGHPFRVSVSYKFGNKNIRAKQVKSTEEIQRANAIN